jgi:hypothetical protein
MHLIARREPQSSLSPLREDCQRWLSIGENAGYDLPSPDGSVWDRDGVELLGVFFTVISAPSELAFWWLGRCGSSLLMPVAIMPGQKPDTVADRVGRGRGGSNGSSSGSSTMGCFVIQMELDRLGFFVGSSFVDSATFAVTSSVDFFLVGPTVPFLSPFLTLDVSSTASSLALEESVSFFRINHNPEPLPWTLMVSFASLSMVPINPMCVNI